MHPLLDELDLLADVISRTWPEEIAIADLQSPELVAAVRAARAGT